MLLPKYPSAELDTSAPDDQGPRALYSMLVHPELIYSIKENAALRMRNLVSLDEAGSNPPSSAVLSVSHADEAEVRFSWAVDHPQEGSTKSSV